MARRGCASATTARQPAPPSYTQFEACLSHWQRTRRETSAPRALAHVVSADPAVATELGEGKLASSRIWNPLSAAGGVAPETGGRRRARTRRMLFALQERVGYRSRTMPTRAMLVGRDVQRAAATFRWTGSWYTSFVTADRFGGRDVDADFEADLRARLERFRMAGHDLEVDGPRPVPLEIELQDLPDARLLRGRCAAGPARGCSVIAYYPMAAAACSTPTTSRSDRLSFSALCMPRRRRSTASRRWTAIVFQRQGKALTSGLGAGRLDMQRLEIARLDNDPNFPERGVVRLHIQEAAVNEAGSLDPDAVRTNDCECCEGISRRLPLSMLNRPGLSAVAYRTAIARTI